MAGNARSDEDATNDRAARLADALDSTAAAVVLTDRTGRLEYANAACVRLVGRPASELSGLPLVALFDVAAAPDAAASLHAVLAEGEDWAGEVAAVAAGGRRVPCMVTLSPIRRAGRDIDGFVITLRDVTERVEMEEALRAANRRLAEAAARDHLTRLYNRGFLREALDKEVARSARYGHPVTVLMVDLDAFKAVNDAEGHDFGDQVLRDVADALPHAVREGDVVSRYGGDEFCILLPSTGMDAGRAVAERVRGQVRDRGLGPEGRVRLTVSVGQATSPDPHRGEPVGAEDLLRRADRALFEAKHGGGDAVVAWAEGA